MYRHNANGRELKRRKRKKRERWLGPRTGTELRWPRVDSNAPRASEMKEETKEKETQCSQHEVLVARTSLPLESGFTPTSCLLDSDNRPKLMAFTKI